MNSLKTGHQVRFNPQASLILQMSKDSLEKRVLNSLDEYLQSRSAVKI
jgi:RNA-binding protein YhbY